MNVELIDYTGAGHGSAAAEWAASMLIFAKSTRLNMSAGLFDTIMAMSEEKKIEELQYIANTIPSSWEFVHYSFLISGVTRAFTHQLVRTRNASYAQQTMRMLGMDDFTYSTSKAIADSPDKNNIYKQAMGSINTAYKCLLAMGAKPEDARGILPTNINTNILMSINLRNLVEMIRKRTSSRVQDEYREVSLLMRDCVLAIHPWSSLFLDRSETRAAMELDAEIQKLDSTAQKLKMTKLLDIVRKW